MSEALPSRILYETFPRLDERDIHAIERASIRRLAAHLGRSNQLAYQLMEYGVSSLGKNTGLNARRHYRESLMQYYSARNYSYRVARILTRYGTKGCHPAQEWCRVERYVLTVGEMAALIRGETALADLLWRPRGTHRPPSARSENKAADNA